MSEIAMELNSHQRSEYGKPDAVKVARPVCAVRRAVISLPQAGGMGEEIPGLSVYLEVKTEGDRSRLSKRCLPESVVR
jgi:hypothetical protein